MASSSICMANGSLNQRDVVAAGIDLGGEGEIADMGGAAAVGGWRGGEVQHAPVVPAHQPIGHASARQPTAGRQGPSGTG